MTVIGAGAVGATSHPDWFRVDWRPVWARLQIPPAALPGVRWKPNQPIVEAHASVLPAIGYSVPRAAVGYTADPILRAHQVADVRFIRGRRGTLQGSEMRTGKTGSTVFAHEEESGVLLVVGPVAARAAWHEWAVRRFKGWCDEDDCSLCTRLGGNRARLSFMPIRHVTRDDHLLANKPDVVFMTFAGARGWHELYVHVKIGTFVVDEAHKAGIQNRNSDTVHAIRKFASVAHRVVLCTGTPLWNRPKGLWPLLDLVAPGAFGKKFPEFGNRYCQPEETAYGRRYEGASREDELRVRLSELMIRHLWVDLKEELPAFTRSIELIELGAKVASEINAVSTRMRLEAGNAQTLIGELARLRKLFGAAKLKSGLEHIVDRLEQNDSVLVWTWHVDVAEKAVEQLIKAGVRVFGPLTGRMDADEREAMVEQAREYASKGGLFAFVATMAAAAEALDFSFLSHQIFLELDWTPPTIQQAEMRPYNGTQPVTTTFLVADCDVDRDLADALIEKLQTSNKLGLQAGIGDARDLLHASFHNEKLADTLGSRLMAQIAAEE